MDSKKIVWTGMIIGSTLGSFVPLLWGAGELSFSSIIWGAVGGFAGIWIGFKISR
jgi:hypothetical protein